MNPLAAGAGLTWLVKKRSLDKATANKKEIVAIRQQRKKERILRKNIKRIEIIKINTIFEYGKQNKHR